MKHFVAIGLICLGVNISYAQTKKPTTPIKPQVPAGPVQTAPGAVSYNVDAKVDSLVAAHKRTTEFKKYRSGFRVQLYFGPDREKLNKLKESFMAKYGTNKSYVTFSKPNFKLKVGDFTTRMEAFKLMKTIEKDFEAPFIIKDEIKTNLD